MDTIVDSFGRTILTLTERSTNFILMQKLPHGRKAIPTARTVAKLLFPYRNTLRTITTDNGCEFAAHLEITRLLSLKNREKVIVYFADSYCSWQKGAIENANKLIRKYISKKSNFDDFSDKRIMEIQKKLNRRPREKIDFDTPKKRFSIRLHKFAFAVGLCKNLFLVFFGGRGGRVSVCFVFFFYMWKRGFFF